MHMFLIQDAAGVDSSHVNLAYRIAPVKMMGGGVRNSLSSRSDTGNASDRVNTCHKISLCVSMRDVSGFVQVRMYNNVFEDFIDV